MLLVLNSKAKEPRTIFGEDLTKTITTLSTVGGKFTKSVEAVFNKIVDKVTYSASGDEKEAARKVVLINLKGQQVIKLVLASIISTAGSTSYVLGMAAVRYAKNFKKSDKK